MPTTYAHYKFGKEVTGSLPKQLQKAIESNQELFDIGVHGPDIFFYYRVFMTNHVNTTGYELHDQPADAFFLQAAQVIKRSLNQDAARAYIDGFICHFALDSECHKYIEKMIQVNGISHAEIEMEFDRMLLTEDLINPVSYLETEHIHPSMKNAEVISPFFDEVTTAEVKKSLSSMIMIHKLLLAPNPKKRRFLFTAMKLTGQYESKHGMVMSETPNPACQDYCRLLKKLYKGAVPLAVGLILKYHRLLSDGIELPSRFHETFGPGDRWQDLPL